jgi:hypothetical protein
MRFFQMKKDATRYCRGSLTHGNRQLSIFRDGFQIGQRLGNFVPERSTIKFW